MAILIMILEFSKREVGSAIEEKQNGVRHDLRLVG